MEMLTESEARAKIKELSTATLKKVVDSAKVLSLYGTGISLGAYAGGVIGTILGGVGGAGLVMLARRELAKRNIKDKVKTINGTAKRLPVERKRLVKENQVPVVANGMDDTAEKENEEKEKDDK